MVKKKSGKKNKKKEMKENFDGKMFLGLGILAGLFFIFGFALNISNITGYATGPVEDIKSIGTGLMDLLEPFAKLILGDVGGSGELLFAKVLFFLIVFGIVYLSLDQVGFFNQSRGVFYLITFSVSILAVRWIGGSDIIQTIILPYSAVGIAVSAGLPFVIYFLVVNKGLSKQPGLVRQTAWAFFAIVFIGLWFSRGEEILGNFRRIYLFTALAALLMMVIDGTVQKYFIKIDAGRTKLNTNKDVIKVLKMKLAESAEAVRTGAIGIKEYEDFAKETTKKIVALSKS